MANKQTAVLNNRFFIAFPPSGRTQMRKAYEVVNLPGLRIPGVRNSLSHGRCASTTGKRGSHHCRGLG